MLSPCVALLSLSRCREIYSLSTILLSWPGLLPTLLVVSQCANTKRFETGGSLISLLHTERASEMHSSSMREYIVGLNGPYCLVLLSRKPPIPVPVLCLPDMLVPSGLHLAPCWETEMAFYWYVKSREVAGGARQAAYGRIGRPLPWELLQAQLRAVQRCQMVQICTVSNREGETPV